MTTNESTNQLIRLGPDGKRIWDEYWLEHKDGRWILCRKSHPEQPDDDNVDFIDCAYAFELD